MSMLIIIISILVLALNLFSFVLGGIFLYNYKKMNHYDALIIADFMFLVVYGTAGILIPTSYFVFELKIMSLIFTTEFLIIFVINLIKYKYKLF